MNKLLIALIASAGVSLVSAQTAAPTAQERQKDVQSATQGGSGSSTSAQKTAAEQAKNTAVSKETAKMSTADKNAAGVNFRPVAFKLEVIAMLAQNPPGLFGGNRLQPF